VLDLLQLSLLEPELVLEILDAVHDVVIPGGPFLMHTANDYIGVILNQGFLFVCSVAITVQW